MSENQLTRGIQTFRFQLIVEVKETPQVLVPSLRIEVWELSDDPTWREVICDVTLTGPQSTTDVLRLSAVTGESTIPGCPEFSKLTLGDELREYARVRLRWRGGAAIHRVIWNYEG